MPAEVLLHSGRALTLAVTAGKMYACQYCDAVFAQSIELSRHVRTHTGDKPYVCRECGKGFRQANGLSIHLRTFHSESDLLPPWLGPPSPSGPASAGSWQTHLHQQSLVRVFLVPAGCLSVLWWDCSLSREVRLCCSLVL